uniref:porin n=1 Tax=Burkholderia gladioli TaxID=28095 RepID=UPI0016413F0B
AGFSGGVMYAFGGVAGSVGADNTVSAGLNYERGAFGIGAAYTNEKYGPAPGTPSTSVRNWGVGMHYDFGAVTAKALLTTVHNSFNDAGVWMAEAGGVWRIRPDVFLGAKYMYMKGNEAVNDNHAHQVSVALQYLLTERTMVYVSADYQRANNGANAQINGVLDPDGASSSASQAVARVGLHTMF